MKTYHVRMKYIFKDCDYIIVAQNEDEALELAKRRRESEWQKALDEVAYWQTIPHVWEQTTNSATTDDTVT